MVCYGVFESNGYLVEISLFVGSVGIVVLRYRISGSLVHLDDSRDGIGYLSDGREDGIVDNSGSDNVFRERIGSGFDTVDVESVFYVLESRYSIGVTGIAGVTGERSESDRSENDEDGDDHDELDEGEAERSENRSKKERRALLSSSRMRGSSSKRVDFDSNGNYGWIPVFMGMTRGIICGVLGVFCRVHNGE